jgi:WD40 repeat protein
MEETMTDKKLLLALILLFVSLPAAAETAGSEDQPTMVVNKVHAGEIKNLIYSPDGKYLMSGNSVGEVTIWDMRTRLPARTWQACIHGLWWLAVSPDSRSLVTACAKGSGVAVKDGGVKVWDMETGKVRLEPEAGEGVRQVACLPGGLLVVPDYDGRITFFDLATGKKIRSLRRTFREL